MSHARAARARAARVGLAAAVVGATMALGACGGSAQANANGCTPPPQTPTAAKSFASAPPPSDAQHTTWTATLQTNCGKITVQLYGDKAPQTVSSFLHLARADYWKDSPCHRLTTEGIYVLQCGDPTGTGTGTPGYGFGIENAPADGDYPPGTLAMARSMDPNSNGGQFFIVYRDTKLPTAGGGYSIFGKVTGGMDIVRTIAKAGVAKDAPRPGDGAPAQPISILSVSVQQAQQKG
ncbi:MAG TPA: peptidylprolyl isomerase [Segeticoccus sp.]|uniref:peptidylprolyl isomerase n=1 Tax=Segeticoccus sp. TaxID=2706531 RepID=UPI002D7E1B27|nr:peptidylprolyl isomerase [Segeticoccus sp.]HET8599636.1 peptidylprolyl isomerase [Segeticoccus sp.]